MTQENLQNPCFPRSVLQVVKKENEKRCSIRDLCYKQYIHSCCTVQALQAIFSRLLNIGPKVGHEGSRAYWLRRLRAQRSSALWRDEGTVRTWTREMKTAHLSPTILCNTTAVHSTSEMNVCEYWHVYKRHPVDCGH